MKVIVLFIGALLFAGISHAQLVITTQSNAQLLAQKLVGDGVTISNVTLSGDPVSTGFFNNISGTNIGLDSGIVLTNGRAKTASIFEIGLDGDGITPAYDPSGDAFATNDVNWAAHDSDLEHLIGVDPDETHDATILEFDFVPVGDSIKFRYVFSSEEYPDFSCPGFSNFNDAFAFFIQGPGFPARTNIALIPGSTDPVTINNINDQACGVYPLFYINNEANVNFTHNGHTVVLTAMAQVVPCQTYHLKLVIADVADGAYDSGVFLEAKSLTSTPVKLSNNTQTDVLNNSYIVEGCVTGSFVVKRHNAPNYPLVVRLSYGGTAVNGVDVQMLPSLISILANDSIITINVVPVIDNLPEGIEYLKIYAAPGCGTSNPVDSTIIQIRDYDTLGIVAVGTVPGSPFICKDATVQLQATANPTSTYQWSAEPGLTGYHINNPFATPNHNAVTYTCAAALGACHQKDSILLRWKELTFSSAANVNCHNAATGQIIVSASPGWANSGLQYSLNSLPAQGSGTFNNLLIGDYMVHLTDASGCKDSLPVHVIQAYPDLVITDTATQAATCTSISDGLITIQAAGGKPPYRYSNNGSTFQTSNIFHVGAATFTVSVLDANNCRVDMPGVVVPFINGVTLTTGPDPVICESKTTVLPATTNASSVTWSAALPGQQAALNNPALTNPTANPIVTTKYYIIARLGTCSLKDSVTVIVNAAPIANAGNKLNICFGGQANLEGSGGVMYHWSPATYLSNPGISNPVVSQASSIIYQLDVTDAHGCESLVSSHVSVTVMPPATLFAGNDTAVAINQPLILLATDINHIGFTHYSWSPSTGLSNPFYYNPVATLTADSTNFIVTATTVDHCIGIDTIKVKTYRGPEIYVANSFTPNGDGLHDVLKAFPVGIKTFHYFYIYNRYGQLVFSTSNPDKGWDGKVKGAGQALSTFVWIAEGIDFKGHVIQRKGTTIIIK